MKSLAPALSGHEDHRTVPGGLERRPDVAEVPVNLLWQVLGLRLLGLKPVVFLAQRRATRPLAGRNTFRTALVGRTRNSAISRSASAPVPETMQGTKMVLARRFRLTRRSSAQKQRPPAGTSQRPVPAPSLPGLTCSNGIARAERWIG